MAVAEITGVDMWEDQGCDLEKVTPTRQVGKERSQRRLRSKMRMRRLKTRGSESRRNEWAAASHTAAESHRRVRPAAEGTWILQAGIC